jgi:hypothetical protein
MSPDKDLVKNLKASLTSGARLAKRGHAKPVVQTIWMIQQIKWHIIGELKVARENADWAQGGREGETYTGFRGFT